MTQYKSKAINKSFSVTERTLEQLEKLVVKFDAMSPSEALRRAVNQAFEKEFPDYIYNKSATDLSKRKAIEKEVERETMSDREYLQKFAPGGVFVTLKDGREVYLIHAFSKNLELIFVDKGKVTLEKDPLLATYHKDKLDKGITLESLMTPYSVRYLEGGYNIELSDETKRKFGVTDQGERVEEEGKSD